MFVCPNDVMPFMSDVTSSLTARFNIQLIL